MTAGGTGGTIAEKNVETGGGMGFHRSSGSALSKQGPSPATSSSGQQVPPNQQQSSDSTAAANMLLLLQHGYEAVDDWMEGLLEGRLHSITPFGVQQGAGGSNTGFAASALLSVPSNAAPPGLGGNPSSTAPSAVSGTTINPIGSNPTAAGAAGAGASVALPDLRMLPRPFRGEWNQTRVECFNDNDKDAEEAAALRPLSSSSSGNLSAAGVCPNCRRGGTTNDDHQRRSVSEMNSLTSGFSPAFVAEKESSENSLSKRTKPHRRISQNYITYSAAANERKPTSIRSDSLIEGLHPLINPSRTETNRLPTQPEPRHHRFHEPWDQSSQDQATLESVNSFIRYHRLKLDFEHQEEGGGRGSERNGTVEISNPHHQERNTSSKNRLINKAEIGKNLLPASKTNPTLLTTNTLSPSSDRVKIGECEILQAFKPEND